MNDDLHALTGAYVLDALDDDERHDFEAYMATSPATVTEVASLREAAAILAGGAAETPPEGLRRAVMSSIDNVRQERPAVVPIESAPSVRSGRTAPPSWVTRATSLVAGVAVLVAVGLGVTVANLGTRLDQVEETSTQVARLLAAPDAVRHEGSLPTGGTVTAVISPDHGAVVLARDLPPLPSDRAYALWAIRDGAPAPVGTLANDDPVTVSSIGLDGFGLTVEPLGPLPDQPTGAVELALGA